MQTALQALLASVFVLTWSAFENMANDLWENARDCLATS
jgi:hypothetical protein